MLWKWDRSIGEGWVGDGWVGKGWAGVGSSSRLRPGPCIPLRPPYRDDAADLRMRSSQSHESPPRTLYPSPSSVRRTGMTPLTVGCGPPSPSSLSATDLVSLSVLRTAYRDDAADCRMRSSQSLESLPRTLYPSVLPTAMTPLTVGCGPPSPSSLCPGPCIPPSFLPGWCRWLSDAVLPVPRVSAPDPVSLSVLRKGMTPLTVGCGPPSPSSLRPEPCIPLHPPFRDDAVDLRMRSS